MKRSRQQAQQERRSLKAASRKRYQEATGRTPTSKYALKKSARPNQERA